MKKTQIIELLANIKNTIVPFISIIFFIVLTLGVFTGLGFSGFAFTQSIEKQYEDDKLYDFEIIYPYGLSLSDLDELSKLKEVSEIEGDNIAYGFYELNGVTQQARIFKINENINKSILKEGRLPEKSGEIAVEYEYSQRLSLKIGDEINFKHDDDGYSHIINDILKNDIDEIKEIKDSDGMKYLKTDNFVITGFIENSKHIVCLPSALGVSNDSIPLSSFMLILKEDMDEEAFGGYTDILIRSDLLREYDTGSKEYNEVSALIKEKILEKASELSLKKSDSLIDSAANLLSTSKDKINDGQEKIENAELDIEKAKKDISDGEKDINKAYADIRDFQLKIADGEKEIADGEEKLSKGKEQLLELKQKLDDGIVSYDEGLSKLNIIKDYRESAIEPINTALNASDSLLHIKDDISAYLNELDTNYPEFNEAALKLVSLLAKDDFLADESAYFYKAIEIYDVINGLEIPPSISSLKDKLTSFENEVLKVSGTVKFAFMLFGNQIDDSIFSESGKAALDRIKVILVDPSFGNETETVKALYLFDELLDNCNQLILEMEESLAKEKKKLDDGYSQYETGILEIEDGEDELFEAKRKAKEAKEEIEEAKTQLNTYIKDLNNGKKEVEEGQIKLEDSKEELKDAQDKYDELSLKLSSLERYDAGISTRNSNTGFAAAKTVSDMFEKVKTSLTAVFALVGMFVLYSAITRIVYSQTRTIGTKKALGFSDRQIIISMLSYSFVAALIGDILGILCGRYVIQRVMLNTLSKNYMFQTPQYYSNIGEESLYGLIVLLVCLIITYIASKNVLKKEAIELLSDNSVKEFRAHRFEKSRLWKRMPLLNKTMVNNTLLDKRRVFATIVGVAGCSALMISGFTTAFNVNDSFSRNHDKILGIDALVYYDTSNADTLKSIKETLDEKGLLYSDLYITYNSLKKIDGSNNLCQLFVSDTEFDKVFKIYNSKDELMSIEDGTFLSSSFYKFYDLKEGDYIDVVDFNKKEHSLKISESAEFYLPRNILVMNKNDYSSYFEEDYVPNCIAVNLRDSNFEELNSSLKDIEGVIIVNDYYDDSLTSFKTMSSIATGIGMVYVASAFLMAILVLLNLFAMHILEKKRELITLMINGYSLKQAKKYIYVDTIFLSIIGLVLGLIIGNILGISAVGTFNTSISLFITDINVKANIYAIIITLLLICSLSMLSLRKIAKFDLSDINK